VCFDVSVGQNGEMWIMYSEQWLGYRRG